MFNKILLLMAGTAIVLLQGCAPIPPDEKIEGVVRIFMHEPGRYTVLTQKSPTSPIIEQRVPGGNLTDTKYVRDVPENQPMWVSVHYERYHTLNVMSHIIFHIHSVHDINGAGWNHGKFGRGQTVVIQ